jgi:hypothetical protein
VARSQTVYTSQTVRTPPSERLRTTARRGQPSLGTIG